MELGWGNVVQAVLIAISTWYMRRGNKNDTSSVIRTTAAQRTSNEILERVQSLEAQVQLIRTIVSKGVTIDDRGPSSDSIE